MAVYRPDDTTVVICAAGMGTRLGIGTTKALVDINGKPIIIRLLELLNDYDDVRIVVGFNADRLIRVVNEYRKDIVFAFNYKYEMTGVADSLQKGLLEARNNIISLDGDIVVNPEDFLTFLSDDRECLGITPIASKEPVRATVENGHVMHLSKTEGNMQWPGIVKIKKEKLIGKSSHVYDLLNEALPLHAFSIRAREINTQDDYDQAIEWYERGMID